VQFHPSVLWIGPDARGQQALVSEAVRGEGAILYDGLGRRVMEGVHPLEDLAPRDVVAAAISRRMAEAPGGVGDHVFLDATHLGAEFYDRFPSITASCRAAGVDPATERIPVAPAAHYACGGVPADLDGATEMTGLYAIGEVACTGVHGANRLASNSVTEGVVAGTRLGSLLAARLPTRVELGADAGRSFDAPLRNPAQRVEMRSVMSSQVGVLRTPWGIEGAIRQLEALASTSSYGVTGSRAAWEATNMLTVAATVATAAATRTESRGCHRREDHPAPRDAWLTHLDVRLTIDGGLAVTGIPHV
jgi:L-aspartate oxidase